MASNKIESQAEFREKTALNLPAVESFLDPEIAAEVWPECIAKSEEFLNQSKERKTLIENVNAVFDRLPAPDISFRSAVEDGLVTEDQIKKAYDSLTKLLESGEDYRRIILYLPFEILPEKNWKPGEDLEKSADNFRQSYMETWYGLLQTHDVRANFVDGDVLEVEQRTKDLPRVVKAAHLIPVLLQKRFIQVQNAMDLMKEADDEVLEQSVGEALLVAADMGLIPKDKIPDLPKKSNAEEPKEISEKRKKWLEEKEREKSLPPLTEPVVGAEKLSGPFSKNLETLQPELEEIQKMTRAAEIDPELSQYIYPTTLVFGSKVKGYGNPDADIDIAVFIKPGTDFRQREKLQALLRENFQHEKIGQPVEFWLDEKTNRLNVHNHRSNDPVIGTSYDAHILFGAAWEGNIETIRQIREKLLVQYFSDNINRKTYLEELERDTLQYRLMHKGYQRFFPPCGGIHTEHSDRIDGESMFYDSGYRQLATKLFASRVFLPKIEK